MARSRRRRTIFGITTCRSEKLYKRFEQRRRRRFQKVKIQKSQDLENIVFDDDVFGDPWLGPKDGKQFWSVATPKSMRK